jgi:hypothetical protein
MASPELGECYWAIAEAGGRHVRLKVEYTQTGWSVHITETDRNTEVACGRAHDPYDLAEAEKYAEETANSYLADKDLKLPTVKWTKCSRQ